MRLCMTCFDKLKDNPDIGQTGKGTACFGGIFCEECGKRVTRFIEAEILESMSTK